MIKEKTLEKFYKQGLESLDEDKDLQSKLNKVRIFCGSKK